MKGRGVSWPGVWPAVVAWCLLCATGFASQRQSPHARVVLQPGRQITGNLGPNQVHRYGLLLGAGQYARVIVDQHGIDVAVAVFDPGNAHIYDVDTSEDGREPVSIAAVAAGTYGIEIRVSRNSGRSGQYAVAVEELRQVAPVDQKRIQAEGLSTEAKRLQAESRASSLETALVINQKALTLWRDLKDRLGETTALLRMGDVYHALTQYDRARDYYEQALPLSRALGDRRSEGEILNNLGMGYWRTGRTDEAAKSLSEAMEIWRRTEFPYEKAATVSNLGILYWQTGEWQKAIQNYTEALTSVRSLGDRYGEAFVLSNLGVAYSSLGENGRGVDYLDQAVKAFRALGERAAEARSLSTEVRIYLGTGSESRAIESLDRAIPLARAVGDARTEAELLNYLGQAYCKRDPAAALDRYKEALSKFQTLNDRRSEGRVLANIATLYSTMGKPDLAMKTLDLALAIRHEVNTPDEEAETLYAMAQVDSGEGDLSRALTRIDSALEIIESLRSKASGPGLRASYLASKLEYYEFAVDLLMRLSSQSHQQGFERAAFELAERARARSLLEMLGEGEIRQGVDAALLARERELRHEVSFRSNQLARLLGDKHNPEQITDLRNRMDTLLTEYEQVQSEVLAASPRYTALTQLRPLSLVEIQTRILDDETVLLMYSLGRKSSYGWAVTSATFQSFQLPPRDEVERVARQVAESISKPGRSSIDGSSVAVARMLLGPVANELGRKRLVIVGDGAIQCIPFAALPDPEMPGRPLIALHEVVTEPSASTLGRLRDDTAGREMAPKALAVLADPVFDLDDARVQRAQSAKLASAVRGAAVEDAALSFGRLPFTRREARAILSMVPTTDGLAALDFAANKATAMSPELQNYRIVHIATHAVVDNRHPELSGLVLSLVDEQGHKRDGFLRLHEIWSLNLPVELVVLSACRTGLGREVKGEGLVGLSTGFLSAGAARVVVSLWNVDDESTSALMEHFYQGMLREHLKPAAALRAAQLAIRDAPRWRDPYYWAGVNLLGEWR